MAEQGLYSMVGFGATVLLARWMTPAEFGSFSLAFAAFLIGAGFYNALVLEPAMVLGPSAYRDDLHGYLKLLPPLHWRITLPIAVVAGVPLTVLTAVEPNRPLPRALLAAVLSLPLLLRIWLARRVAYIVLEPRRAIFSNILYATLAGSGLVLLRATARLSAVTALGCLAIASYVASVPTLRSLGLNRASPGDGRASRDLLRTHWRFGRWIVWATLAGAVSLHGPDYFAGALLGLGAAGSLAAMETAALPVVQALTALGFLVLPALARQFGAGEVEAVRRKARHVTAVLATLAAAYAVLILLLHGPLERIVFGGKYAHSAMLMSVMAIYPVFMALGLSPSLFLRAVQHPQHYLVGNALIAPVGLLAPLILTWRFGLSGSAWSVVVIYAAAWIAFSVLARRWQRQHGLKVKAAPPPA